MKTSTETTPAASTFALIPVIRDLDCSDCSTKLAKLFNGRDLSVEEFDAAMLRFAAEKRRTGGGYAKLRGVFAFGEHTIEFRIDVDALLKEGRTLAKVWRNRAIHCASERGASYLRACKQDPEEAAALYKEAAFASI